MIYDEHLLMESDDDCQIIANIVIGYDVRGNLVIQLGVYDDGWDYPEGFRYVAKDETTATIDVDDLDVMAAHLNRSKGEVLNHLLGKFGGSGYVARTSYVKNCFKEILEYILDCGGKYRLSQT